MVYGGLGFGGEVWGVGSGVGARRKEFPAFTNRIEALGFSGLWLLYCLGFPVPANGLSDLLLSSTPAAFPLCFLPGRQWLSHVYFMCGLAS